MKQLEYAFKLILLDFTGYVFFHLLFRLCTKFSLKSIFMQIIIHCMFPFIFIYCIILAFPFVGKDLVSKYDAGLKCSFQMLPLHSRF